MCALVLRWLSAVAAERWRSLIWGLSVLLFFGNLVGVPLFCAGTANAAGAGAIPLRESANSFKTFSLLIHRGPLFSGEVTRELAAKAEK